LPGPVSTCELDGSGVYEAQGADGSYRYCVHGHRWPSCAKAGQEDRVGGRRPMGA
jgi:hypothetical protein